MYISHVYFLLLVLVFTFKNIFLFNYYLILITDINSNEICNTYIEDHILYYFD